VATVVVVVVVVGGRVMARESTGRDCSGGRFVISRRFRGCLGVW
jgi:hypothetical protein